MVRARNFEFKFVAVSLLHFSSAKNQGRGENGYQRLASNPSKATDANVQVQLHASPKKKKNTTYDHEREKRKREETKNRMKSKRHSKITVRSTKRAYAHLAQPFVCFEYITRSFRPCSACCTILIGIGRDRDR